MNCRKSVVLIFLVLALPASAHDFWSNASKVDPVTKLLCCDDADYFRLEPDQIVRVVPGYRVRGRFETRDGWVGLDQIIPAENTQPSPDGYFHVNIVDGSIRCFFAPVSF